MRKTLLRVRKHLRTVTLVIQVGIITGAALVPLVANETASAAQLTFRSVGISSARASQTGQTYTYGFTNPTSSTIQSIEFEACTTALGSCTGPTGLNINQGSEASRSGWSAATTFTRDAVGGGGCTPGNNVLCIKRTSGTSETSGARSLGWDTQENPSTAGTFFIRISIYSDNAWATGTDTGTVAASINQPLTVNAAVQEVLSFCVGSTTVDDATTSPGADCAAISGTSLNLGTLDTSAVSVSPVTTNGGDSKNGIAMLRTNAVSGASVVYKAIQQSGTNHLGTLRVSGASCNAGTVQTDQCIDAQGTTQATFTAGTEKFGMTIGGVNCGSTSAYTCTFTAGTYNLTRDAAYDGNGANTYGTSQGFAWDESGTADTIASSASVVDDESLIMKFAATPSITTPTGAYTAQADYIATATY